MTDDRQNDFDFDNESDFVIAEEYVVRFLNSSAQRNSVTIGFAMEVIQWLRNNDYKVNFKYIESVIQFMIKNTMSILDHYGKFNENLIKNTPQ